MEFCKKPVPHFHREVKALLINMKHKAWQFIPVFLSYLLAKLRQQEPALTLLALHM